MFNIENHYQFHICPRKVTIQKYNFNAIVANDFLFKQALLLITVVAAANAAPLTDTDANVPDMVKALNVNASPLGVAKKSVVYTQAPKRSGRKWTLPPCPHCSGK